MDCITFSAVILNHEVDFAAQKFSELVGTFGKGKIPGDFTDRVKDMFIQFSASFIRVKAKCLPTNNISCLLIPCDQRGFSKGQAIWEFSPTGSWQTDCISMLGSHISRNNGE